MENGINIYYCLRPTLSHFVRALICMAIGRNISALGVLHCSSQQIAKRKETGRYMTKWTRIIFICIYILK